MTTESLTPDAALVRLGLYGERTKTWSTATYDTGAERALHEIATTLGAEVVRLRSELGDRSVKQPLDIPTVVAICGSTRFMAEMTEADLRETAAGRIVVKPGCNMKEPHPLWADPHAAETLKVGLDVLHKAKIRLADEVLVVGDYIGDSTRSEIAYAHGLGKPVRYTHPEVAPEGLPSGS